MPNSLSRDIKFRHLGLTGYHAVWNNMKAFTLHRGAGTIDEVWITQHDPVYTLGLNARGKYHPLRDDIPLVETDRGGKITYHGPGQIMVYLLLDLSRRKLGLVELVSSIEQWVLELLAMYGLTGGLIYDAPGVYVNQRKIASIGLRLKKGYCYHGFSINVAMDLSPFEDIDPCGYKGLKVTQLRDLNEAVTISDVATHMQDLISSDLCSKSIRGF